MYERYAGVPWYRRSVTVAVATLVGLVVLPAAVFAAAVALTGPVYAPAADGAGGVARWSAVKRAVPPAALVIQLIFVILIYQQFAAIIRAIQTLPA